MIPERLVAFRPRAILSALGVLLAVGVVLYVLWVARQVISWFLIALFLALAINPAIEWLHRHHIPRRGFAVAIVFVLVLGVVGAVAALLVPTLVSQLNDLVNAIPGFVRQLTHGRGPLGFLETRFHVVERAQRAIGRGGASTLFASAGVLVQVGKSIVTGIVATVTIIFMTLFMLLEGPSWLERLFGLLRPKTRPRWHHVAHEIYRTVGGYVTGNLLISVIAGVVAGVSLAALGVPYPLALGFAVALLDLIPLAGATLGGILVVIVAFTHGTTAGIVMIVVLTVYQQLENHLLQPLIYGRTVQLSPLAVLVSVLIGAEVAGIIGALGAIPIAGTLQVLLRDAQRQRRARFEAEADGGSGGAGARSASVPPQPAGVG